MSPKFCEFPSVAIVTNSIIFSAYGEAGLDSGCPGAEPSPAANTARVGDAFDFGDLTASYYTSGGTSNGHGGL